MEDVKAAGGGCGGQSDGGQCWMLDHGGGGSRVSTLFMHNDLGITLFRFHWEDHAFLTNEGLKRLFGDAEEESREFVGYVKDT